MVRANQLAAKLEYDERDRRELYLERELRKRKVLPVSEIIAHQDQADGLCSQTGGYRPHEEILVQMWLGP